MWHVNLCLIRSDKKAHFYEKGRKKFQQPNGLAHLPPIIARQESLKTTFSAKWPPRTRAEGG